MDYNQLSGPQRAILRKAIVEAFVPFASFDMFLQDRLNKPSISRWAAGQTDEYIAFNAIKVAQGEGWLEDLVAAVQEERPRNPLVRNLADALRLAVPSVRANAPSLEQVVRGGGFMDIAIWAGKLSAIGQALCRVECNRGEGQIAYGTGLLVANDLVLTNFHVVQKEIAASDGSTIRCRFDYARDTKGINDGREVALAAGNAWIVAQSPVDEVDRIGAGKADPANLDFALLRLAAPAGQDDVGQGLRRGTVAIKSSPPGIVRGQPLFVLQHPNAQPMALSIGVSVDSPVPTRVRYDADTLPGSSGSGVFNQALEFVALHHAGHPGAQLSAPSNQGIPMGLIVSSLAGKGVQKFWQ